METTKRKQLFYQVSSCSGLGEREVRLWRLQEAASSLGWFAGPAGLYSRGWAGAAKGTVQGGEPLGSRAALALNPEAGPEPGLHEQVQASAGSLRRAWAQPGAGPGLTLPGQGERDRFLPKLCF